MWCSVLCTCLPNSDKNEIRLIKHQHFIPEPEGDKKLFTLFRLSSYNFQNTRDCLTVIECDFNNGIIFLSFKKLKVFGNVWKWEKERLSKTNSMGRKEAHTHKKEKHKMTNNQNDKIEFLNMEISKLSFDARNLSLLKYMQKCTNSPCFRHHTF